MIVSSAEMTAMYLTACAIGFALGFIYDLMSAVRAKIGMAFMFDIIFSLICAGSIIYFTVALCSGLLRIYNLIGFALGALVYSMISGKIKSVIEEKSKLRKKR